MRVVAAVLAVLLSGTMILAEIRASLFRHHFIARELPGKNVGLGSPALADFDKDGDLDFAVFNRGDGQVYWYENRGEDEWTRRLVGALPVAQLGCTVLDVDRDGWLDILVGGHWFRNSRDPYGKGFVRYVNDRRIKSEIHDLVTADMDGDGKPDVVALGDKEGLFWYAIPEQPAVDGDWPRKTITLDVLDQNADIHGGFAPGGIGDLDGDGDADIVLADRWLENVRSGEQWMTRRLSFGRRSMYGVSSRSWVDDVDGDGDQDIVIADCDGQNSAVAWLENSGQKPPRFTTHYLANQAPGTRGSFHALWYADFDNDGDKDVLVVEQEDPSILPVGASPRWIMFERTTAKEVTFVERVILDARLGGHDIRVGDVDGDGDLDIVSKVWSVWKGNGNGGTVHIDWMENLTRHKK